VCLNTENISAFVGFSWKIEIEMHGATMKIMKITNKLIHVKKVSVNKAVSYTKTSGLAALHSGEWYSEGPSSSLTRYVGFLSLLSLFLQKNSRILFRISRKLLPFKSFPNSVTSNLIIDALR
jgi:hypothetical protein